MSDSGDSIEGVENSNPNPQQIAGGGDGVSPSQIGGKLAASNNQLGSNAAASDEQTAGEFAAVEHRSRALELNFDRWIIGGETRRPSSQCPSSPSAPSRASLILSWPAGKRWRWRQTGQCAACVQLHCHWQNRAPAWP
jgi:hypothetical protein